MKRTTPGESEDGVETSMMGVALAAGSALAWSILDVGRKRIGERARATSALAWLSLLQLPALAPWLLAGALTPAAEQGIFLPPLPILSLAYFWRLAMSFALNVVANLLFLRSVQISPLSLTTPYLSLTPVFTALLALVFFGELPHTWGWAGIGLVCAGAFLLNGATEGDEGSRWLAPFSAMWRERGSLYMVGVALIWSASAVLDKGASEEVGAIWHTTGLAAALGGSFVIWRAVGDGGVAKMWGEFRARGRWFLIGGAAGAAAMMLQLGAYAYVDMAYVETIKRAIGVVLAMIAGHVMFGEQEIGRRVLAAGVMVLGVAMILLGS